MSKNVVILYITDTWKCDDTILASAADTMHVLPLRCELMFPLLCAWHSTWKYLVCNSILNL